MVRKNATVAIPFHPPVQRGRQFSHGQVHWSGGACESYIPYGVLIMTRQSITVVSLEYSWPASRQAKRWDHDILIPCQDRAERLISKSFVEGALESCIAVTAGE